MKKIILIFISIISIILTSCNKNDIPADAQFYDFENEIYSIPNNYEDSDVLIWQSSILKQGNLFEFVYDDRMYVSLVRNCFKDELKSDKLSFIKILINNNELGNVLKTSFNDLKVELESKKSELWSNIELSFEFIIEDGINYIKYVITTPTKHQMDFTFSNKIKLTKQGFKDIRMLNTIKEIIVPNISYNLNTLVDILSNYDPNKICNLNRKIGVDFSEPHPLYIVKTTDKKRFFINCICSTKMDNPITYTDKLFEDDCCDIEKYGSYYNLKKDGSLENLNHLNSIASYQNKEEETFILGENQNFDELAKGEYIWKKIELNPGEYTIKVNSKSKSNVVIDLYYLNNGISDDTIISTIDYDENKHYFDSKLMLEYITQKITLDEPQSLYIRIHGKDFKESSSSGGIIITKD